MAFSYLFGPVASGRLGMSLGLDLLGRRVCSMDCLYCEVGRTEEMTVRRAPYVPARLLLAELEQWREENTKFPDHVTLGGEGEPCLNSEMEAIIHGCHRILPGVPVAVLTNSTLLADEAVRGELALADVVLPSLDSLVEHEFKTLNRPCGGLRAKDIAEALLRFRHMFHGGIFLEILLAQGINDSEENLALLVKYVQRLAPDRVDVTTLSRPGAYAAARAVDRDILTHWSAILTTAAGLPARTADGKGTLVDSASPGSDFGGGKDVPAATRPHGENQLGSGLIPRRDQATATDMVARSLERRPQTASQLAHSLALPPEQVDAALSRLLLDGVVHRVGRTGMETPTDSARTDTAEPFYSCQ